MGEKVFRIAVILLCVLFAIYGILSFTIFPCLMDFLMEAALAFLLITLVLGIIKPGGGVIISSLACVKSKNIQKLSKGKIRYCATFTFPDKKTSTLWVTKDQYDSIDTGDNVILKHQDNYARLIKKSLQK